MGQRDAERVIDLGLIREHVTDGVCETLYGSEAIAFWRAIGEALPLAGVTGRAVWRISVAPARGAEPGAGDIAGARCSMVSGLGRRSL